MSKEKKVREELSAAKIVSDLKRKVLPDISYQVNNEAMLTTVRMLRNLRMEGVMCSKEFEKLKHKKIKNVWLEKKNAWTVCQGKKLAVV